MYILSEFRGIKFRLSFRSNRCLLRTAYFLCFLCMCMSHKSNLGTRMLPLIYLCIGSKKLSHVFERDDNIFERLLYSFFRKSQRLASHYGRIQDIESKGIRTVFLQQSRRIRIVLFAFGHFFAVFCKNHARHRHIIKCSTILQCC